jgi:uncharacterized oxidoreductase
MRLTGGSHGRDQSAGAVRLTAALLPVLVGKPHAAVINVTSRLGFMPSTVIPTYCATKAALHSYTQSLRFQLRDTSVQVIEIIRPRANRAAGRAPIQPQRGAVGRVHRRNDGTVADTAAGYRDSREARQPIRFAERDGVYDDIYLAFNQERTTGLGRRTASSTSVV